jgi:mono/diheme cytochrome c family protein
MRPLLLLALALSSCRPAPQPPDSNPERTAEVAAAGDAPAAVATQVPAADLEPPRGIAASAAQVEAGRKLVEQFECNRCHAVPGPEAPLDKQCVGCHQRILRGAFDAPAKAMAAWKRNIVHLTAVPSLATLDGRIRRDWIAGYLLSPYDQRPRLEASMPRLPLTPAQAEDIAAYLAPSAAPAPPVLGTAEAGLAAWNQGGCAACHGGGDAPAQKYPAVQLAMAPNLRALGEKYHPAGLVRWLEKPSGYMPPIPTDATAVAAYLLARDSPAAAGKPIPARLPVLKRPVRYQEIEDRLFLKMCWHCHSEPDLARGDGGPGNSGGFGYRGVGLSLASYAATAGGSLDAGGRRQSIFRKAEDGTPMIVKVLLVRREEEAGRWNPKVTGMPLGLPAVSPEDIQLVESWVAQGRPP